MENSKIRFTDVNDVPVDATINLNVDILLTNVPVDQTFTITVVDTNGVPTTTEFFGGRPNDRAGKK